jgi:hypothetical protein
LAYSTTMHRIDHRSGVHYCRLCGILYTRQNRLPSIDVATWQSRGILEFPSGRRYGFYCEEEGKNFSMKIITFYLSYTVCIAYLLRGEECRQFVVIPCRLFWRVCVCVCVCEKEKETWFVLSRVLLTQLPTLY